MNKVRHPSHCVIAGRTKVNLSWFDHEFQGSKQKISFTSELSN